MPAAAAAQLRDGVPPAHPVPDLRAAAPDGRDRFPHARLRAALPADALAHARRGAGSPPTSTGRDGFLPSPSAVLTSSKASPTTPSRASSRRARSAKLPQIAVPVRMRRSTSRPPTSWREILFLRVRRPRRALPRGRRVFCQLCAAWMHRQDGPRRAGRRLRAELRSCACRSSPTTRRSTARDARVTRRSAAFVWRLGGALAAFCSQRTATSRARARGVLEGGDQQRHYADSQMINVHRAAVLVLRGWPTTRAKNYIQAPRWKRCWSPSPTLLQGRPKARKPGMIPRLARRVKEATAFKDCPLREEQHCGRRKRSGRQPARNPSVSRKKSRGKICGRLNQNSNGKRLFFFNYITTNLNC